MFERGAQDASRLRACGATLDVNGGDEPSGGETVRRVWCLSMSLLLWPALAIGQMQELENPGSTSAIQERRYRMGHELTLGGGVLPLDAFYKGFFAELG